MFSSIKEAQHKAEEAIRLGDPKLLRGAREGILDHLMTYQKCSEEVFELLMLLLNSDKLPRYPEYGTLISDLAMSKFVFTDEQLKNLLRAITTKYHSFDLPINRMQACVFIVNSSNPMAAADQLIALIQKGTNLGHPIAELVWELSGLVISNKLPKAKEKEANRYIPSTNNT